MPRQITSSEAILAGSCALARRYGLSSISIRGVAKECGISAASIYNYFPSRDELVARTVEKLFEDAFYEGFCNPNPREGYVAYCERLYASLADQLLTSKHNWLSQLQELDTSARAAGRTLMENRLSHVTEGLSHVLTADSRVKEDALTGELDAMTVATFTLEAMLDALRRGRRSCPTLLVLLERSLYR